MASDPATTSAPYPTGRDRWVAGASLAFLLWHGAALGYASLPKQALFPSDPQQAGWPLMQSVEQRLLSLRAVVPPSVFGPYVRTLALSGNWATFAPIPAADATWYSVVVAPGHVLWTNLPGDPIHATTALSPLSVWLSNMPHSVLLEGLLTERFGGHTQGRIEIHEHRLQTHGMHTTTIYWSQR